MVHGLSGEFHSLLRTAALKMAEHIFQSVTVLHTVECSLSKCHCLLGRRNPRSSNLYHR